MTFNDVVTKIEEFEAEKAALIIYCETKVKSRNDWHAVQDAASDIRELDAKIEVLREL